MTQDLQENFGVLLKQRSVFTSRYDFVDRFPISPVTELLYLENFKLEQHYEMSAESVHVKKLRERFFDGRAITLSNVTITQQKCR